MENLKWPQIRYLSLECATVTNSQCHRTFQFDALFILYFQLSSQQPSAKIHFRCSIAHEISDCGSFNGRIAINLIDFILNSILHLHPIQWWPTILSRNHSQFILHAAQYVQFSQCAPLDGHTRNSNVCIIMYLYTANKNTSIYQYY